MKTGRKTPWQHPFNAAPNGDFPEAISSRDSEPLPRPVWSRWWILLAILLGVWVVQSAAGAERFPPPDFSDHALPETAVPASRAAWRDWLDLGALAAGLGLATWLAVYRRSRKGLFALSIVALVWLGFWRKGCICPIGSIQNVALAAFDSSYAIPFTVVLFFALPLLVTLFFGRTFCAAVCPLGAVQELAAVRPVRLPLWLEHGLGLLPFVYLGAGVLLAATGTAFVICEYDPFVSFFRLSPSKMALVGLCFLVIGVFVARPYCRFLCPYGALLGLCSRVAQRHVQIPPTDCINCRLCEDSCPYNAIRLPTVAPPPAERARGRRRLAAMLALAPLLVALGAAVGYGLAGPLSQLSHSVRLAERMQLEMTGAVDGTVDMTDAFRNTGRPLRELYLEAIGIRQRFGILGAALGAWTGLVIGAKLVHLSVRRRRNDYQPDRANCVSCGRCFWYCPVGREDLVGIDGLPAARADGRPAPEHAGEPTTLQKTVT